MDVTKARVLQEEDGKDRDDVTLILDLISALLMRCTPSPLHSTSVSCLRVGFRQHEEWTR